ncbi:hypothetical protein ISCGN_012646 [Ixodes scapularis]
MTSYPFLQLSLLTVLLASWTTLSVPTPRPPSFETVHITICTIPEVMTLNCFTPSSVCVARSLPLLPKTSFNPACTTTRFSSPLFSQHFYCHVHHPLHPSAWKGCNLSSHIFPDSAGDPHCAPRHIRAPYHQHSLSPSFLFFLHHRSGDCWSRGLPSHHPTVQWPRCL